MKSKDVTLKLKEELTPYFEEQGFKPGKTRFQYTADFDDRMDFFSIYIECFKEGCSINTHAAVQLKLVEKLVYNILEKDFSLFEGATLGRRVEVDEISYWYLHHIEDIPSTVTFIKKAFASAREFFQTISRLEDALDFLLSLPSDVFRSQRVIVYAFMIGRYDIVKNISNEVKEKYAWMLDEEESVRKQNYIDFCRVSDYLSDAMQQ